MRTSTELRTTILRRASDLFAEHGYAATSIKHIAAAAGCTTAALYYYFESGKSQILREVIQSYSVDFALVLENATDAESFPAFLMRLGEALARVMPDMVKRISWIVADFARLHADEQAHVHAVLHRLHATIAQDIGRFVGDEREAQRLAWLVFCAYFGYEQIFLTLNLRRIDPLSYGEFAHTMAQALSTR